MNLLRAIFIFFNKKNLKIKKRAKAIKRRDRRDRLALLG